MSDAEQHIDRLRALAERVAERLAGHPGVVRLQETLEVYDRAGGGLVAAGLAYTSMLALLPGLLLGLTVVGIIFRDPADQERIVAMIGQAVPPLEDLARATLSQISTGAVPTSIIAFVGLLWGASRFYANLDTAFSRIFARAPRRNPVVQTVRGVVLTGILVIIPIGLMLLGAFVTWLAELAPEGVALSALDAIRLEAFTPLVSIVVFTIAVAGCYRYVPSERIPWRPLALPAGLVGLVLAVFAQIYGFIMPRLVGVAALYGTFLSLFMLLAWLSIGFNVLLIGAAWTDVRARMGPFMRLPGWEPRQPEPEGEPDAATPSSQAEGHARSG